MPFTLPDKLIWRQVDECGEEFVLEIHPWGDLLGRVRGGPSGRWTTTINLHRSDSLRRHALARSLRQAQYFVGRWCAAHLVEIEFRVRYSRPGAGGSHGMPMGRPTSDPAHKVDRPKVPARQPRRSRRNPSSL